MSALTDHADATTSFGSLTPTTEFALLEGGAPVLATPVAVAAGVTLAAGAAAAGFFAEEANDN